MIPKFIYPLDKAIVWSIISGITILTNAYMLILICRKSKLWSSVNVILGSMFTAGVLFGSVYLLPRFAYGNLVAMGSYCHLLITFGQALSVIFMLHQCLICLDRYFGVLSPLKYRTFATSKIYIGIILITWLIAFFGASIPLMTFNPIIGTTCNMTTHNIEAETVFIFTLLGALFFLPLIVILITYAHIIYIFNHRDPLVLPVNQDGSTKLTFLQKNRKLVMNVAVITTVLIVMWCPYVTIVLIYRVKPVYSSSELTVINIVQYFAFSYPAVSPLLYAYNMKSLRREVVKDYHTCCCRRHRRVHTEFSLRQSNISNVNPSMLSRKHHTAIE